MVLLNKSTIEEILSADSLSVLRTLKGGDWSGVKFPCSKNCDHSTCDRYFALGIHYFSTHYRWAEPWLVQVAACLLQEFATGRVCLLSKGKNKYEATKALLTAFAKGELTHRMEAKEKEHFLGDPAEFTRNAIVVLEGALFYPAGAP